MIERVHRLTSRSDRVQFIVQSNFGFRLPAHGKETDVVNAAAKLEAMPAGQVALLKQPAGSDEFCRQALDTDVGLLLYDRQRYAARCSGVLVELLTAGVPRARFGGLLDGRSTGRRDARLSYRPATQWPRHPDRPSGNRPTYFNPTRHTDLLLFFVWPDDTVVASGTYARVETRLFSHTGDEFDCWTTVVGPSMPRAIAAPP